MTEKNVFKWKMLSKIMLICPICNLKGASFDILEAPAGTAKISILRS